ncbi:ead/Ea22-like family protein [Klebsiella pneumoniae]|uniref:ead/Ea22-like family protein n=1 Tax=Klebsiella pneumoniae TaxID=573 RepID=UPI000B6D6DBD|nr:ead/Ea22-like family protein [Klebsiella pneumoniae]OVU86132.1 hypothetical protein BME07_22860 [Klebsiella pneumoniae]
MTDITELAQRMKAAAEKASNGDWVKESGDGWEACCSANDQANGGFIIAHFEGPDAAENREFVQAANPANIRALVEALEKAQETIAFQQGEIKALLSSLESRTVTVKLPQAVSAGGQGYQEQVERILTAAGIKVEAE